MSTDTDYSKTTWAVISDDFHSSSIYVKYSMLTSFEVNGTASHAAAVKVICTSPRGAHCFELKEDIGRWALWRNCGIKQKRKGQMGKLVDNPPKCRFRTFPHCQIRSEYRQQLYFNYFRTSVSVVLLQLLSYIKTPFEKGSFIFVLNQAVYNNLCSLVSTCLSFIFHRFTWVRVSISHLRVFGHPVNVFVFHRTGC